MIKKSLVVLSVSAAFYMQAQSASVIKNTAEIYSNPSSSGSAKFNGMAGSMGALGGEASTMMVNPAGIGVAISSNISGTLSLENNKNSSSLAGTTTDYSTSKFGIGNVGGIASFQLLTETPWKFVNIAANYSSNSIEDYVETPGNNNLIYDIPSASDALIYKKHAYNRTGNSTKLNLGLSGNYDNRLYLGTSINIYGAQIEQYDSAAFFSQKMNKTEEYFKQYTPYSESSAGFSASFGVIGKMNQQFRLGASLETPTWWTINRTYDYYANPNDGTATEDRNLSSPMKGTLSAAFVPNKNFAINVDYSIGLTKPKYKVYGDAETELNNFFKTNYKNVSEVKIGAEYRISQFRLRGGYALATNPFNSITINNLSVDGKTSDKAYSDLFLGKRNTLALGLGYDFKSMFIDLAYQNVNSQYSNPFLQGFTTYNSGYFGNSYIVDSDGALVSNVKNTKNNISLTIGWKF